MCGMMMIGGCPFNYVNLYYTFIVLQYISHKYVHFVNAHVSMITFLYVYVHQTKVNFT